MTRPPLRAHQATAVEWINTHGRGLLGDPPGLGKTRVAIEAFDKPDTKVLVVAPSLVIAGGTWSDEIERWADHPESFTVAPYSMLNARNGATTNFGTKKNPSYRLRPEYKQVWDAVVVDEAHYTKGRKTSWTWAVQQLAKTTPRLLEMTGTPVPNWAHEIFTILRAVYPERAKPGKELGSHNRWLKEWFEVLPNYQAKSEHATLVGGLRACQLACAERPPWDPCEHYTQFMDANLGGRFLRRKREDCLDLPPATEQTVRTPMSRDQTRVYNELRDDFMTELDGRELITWTTGARTVALDRVTVSPWLLQDPATRKPVPHGGKFDQLRFDLEGRDRPTVVFAHYRDTVEACAAVARDLGARVGYVHGGVSRSKAGQTVKDFKEGRLDVIVGSLETMAEGLQLTAADTLILVEVSFKPSRNEQARMRVHRMGQEHPVTIREYLTPDTLDERKRELLATKTDQQIRLMSARDFAQIL